jgi:hypothetical protein
MVTPFMALIIVIIAVVFFLVKAGKKTSEGRNLGEPGKGPI